MITAMMMIFVLLSGVHGWRLSDERPVVVLDVVATYISCAQAQVH